ncbi:MAG: putative transposase for insertion sequence element, partial [Methylococcaceae bacterium NSP1-1]
MSSLTPGMSAVQFRRQLGLKRYETVFQILHKLRAGMVRPDQDRIGNPDEHVEADETWIGGRTRGKGRGSTSLVQKPSSAGADGTPVVSGSPL